MATAYFPTSASSPHVRGRSRSRHSATMSMPSPQFPAAQPYYHTAPGTPAMSAFSDSQMHQAYGYPTTAATAQAPYATNGSYYVARSPSRHHRRSESQNHHSSHGHHHRGSSKHHQRSHSTTGGHHHSSDHRGHKSSHRHSTSHHRHSSSHAPHRSQSAHTASRRYTYSSGVAPRARYTSQLSVADRIRKFLGIGPFSHHKHYVDQYGRPVDHKGHSVIKY